MASLLRSIAAFAHSNKKKNVVAVVPPAENTRPNTTGSPTECSTKKYPTRRRRRRNRALTENEFNGCILCHLDRLRDNSENLKKPAAGRKSLPLQSFRPSSMCIGCLRREKEGNNNIVPLPDALPSYRKLTKPARNVRFASDTMPAVLNTENPEDEPAVDTEKQEDELAKDAGKEQDDESAVNIGGKQVGTSAMDDLLLALKKDRRRSNNFALSGDDFDKMIIPMLAIPPST